MKETAPVSYLQTILPTSGVLLFLFLKYHRSVLIIRKDRQSISLEFDFVFGIVNFDCFVIPGKLGFEAQDAHLSGAGFIQSQGISSVHQAGKRRLFVIVGNLFVSDGHQLIITGMGALAAG